MKAFRQPTSDVIKSGVKKTPGKQKQVIGKLSKEKEGHEDDIASNKGLESDVLEGCVDKCTHSNPENNRIKPKRPKKFQKKGNGRSKASGTKKIHVANTCNDNEGLDLGVNVLPKKNTLDLRIASSPKVNERRRSLRQKKIKTSTNITPKKPRIRNPFSEAELSDCPLQASTPKANKQSLRKSNMYKAEVIAVPLDGSSPIR